MKILRYLLFPFAFLYGLGVHLRHFLYDHHLLKSKSYPLPIICVGNLAVGGTGKTPMIEYLVRLIGEEHVAILSRGYKRKTRGFSLANNLSSALSLGDEPYQFHRKFPQSKIAVCESRTTGIETLLAHYTPKVILLDDAMQHRGVQAGLTLLLTSYPTLYTKDFLLPVGNLRDVTQRSKAAQVIIVTKCPSLSKEEQQKILKELNPFPYQKVFFTGIHYSEMVYTNNDNRIPLTNFIQTPFTLVTGIANPLPLVHFLKGGNASFEHLQYNDHHHFSAKEIQFLQEKRKILTTEKDFVRLSEYLPEIFYLPIETYFLSETAQEDFNTIIKSYISNNKRS